MRGLDSDTDRESLCEAETLQSPFGPGTVDPVDPDKKQLLQVFHRRPPAPQ